MAGRRRRKMADQDSDYDGAWKDVFRQYLREILEKYLPAIAAAIDGATRRSGRTRNWAASCGSGGRSRWICYPDSCFFSRE